MVGAQKFKMAYVARTAIIRGSLRLTLAIAYANTKFNISSFSRSRDMTAAPKFKIGHVTQAICHPWTRTCWDHPIQPNIWSLSACIDYEDMKVDAKRRK